MDVMYTMCERASVGEEKVVDGKGSPMIARPDDPIGIQTRLLPIRVSEPAQAYSAHWGWWRTALPPKTTRGAAWDWSYRSHAWPQPCRQHSQIAASLGW